MPIRINLLAEQQAAEEARRRDPVKRAIWAGSAVVVLVLLWSVSLHFKHGAAQRELAGLEQRLRKVEDSSRETRAAWAVNGEIEERMKALERYAGERYLWGSALNALQKTVAEPIRLVGFQGIHTYTTNRFDPVRTNILMTIQPPSWWKFWATASAATNVLTHVTNQLTLITNRPMFVTNQVRAIPKVEVSTNKTRVTAKVEIARPNVAIEQIVLTVRARVYGNDTVEAARRVDDFKKVISENSYFKSLLPPMADSSVRFVNYIIHAETDPSDPIWPNRRYIPFTIECRYRERIRADE